MTRLTSSVTAVLCGLVTMLAIITFACAVLPCRVLAGIDGTGRDHTATPGWIAFLSTRTGRMYGGETIVGSLTMRPRPAADVYAIRPDGSGQRLVSDEQYPHRVWAGRWAPGKSALAWVGEKGLMVTDLEQGTTRPILSLDRPVHIRDFAWGPGGDRLAVIFEILGEAPPVLSIYDMEGKVLATWVGPQGRKAKFSAIAWSSTGTLATCLTAKEIWATPDPASREQWYSLLGLEGTPHGTILVADRSLHWSPDGSTLLFVGSRGPHTGKIWLLRADGTDLRPLHANGALPESNASWSPDGKMIAYTSQGHVCTAAVDGSATRDYTPAGARADWPTWSPDGKSLAFASDVEGKWRIYVADVETGATKRLTNGPGDDTDPAWGGR